MGEMADYFFENMDMDYDSSRRGAPPSPFGRLHIPHGGPTYEDHRFEAAREGIWVGEGGVPVAISELSDEHIGAAIGWCLKHFPTESKAKVEELRAEQLRRDFGPIEEDDL